MAVGIFTSMANDELANAIAALQAEIAVLREENAQLRVSRRRSGAATDLAGLRNRTAANRPVANQGPEAPDTDASDRSDAVWQAMTDVIVMRDVLLDMCAQVQLLTAQVQQRLARIAGAAPTVEPPS